MTSNKGLEQRTTPAGAPSSPRRSLPTPCRSWRPSSPTAPLGWTPQTTQHRRARSGRACGFPRTAWGRASRWVRAGGEGGSAGYCWSVPRRAGWSCPLAAPLLFSLATLASSMSPQLSTHPPWPPPACRGHVVAFHLLGGRVCRWNDGAAQGAGAHPKTSRRHPDAHQVPPGTCPAACPCRLRHLRRHVPTPPAPLLPACPHTCRPGNLVQDSASVMATLDEKFWKSYHRFGLVRGALHAHARSRHQPARILCGPSHTHSDTHLPHPPNNRPLQDWKPNEYIRCGGAGARRCHARREGRTACGGAMQGLCFTCCSLNAPFPHTPPLSPLQVVHRRWVQLAAVPLLAARVAAGCPAAWQPVRSHPPLVTTSVSTHLPLLPVPSSSLAQACWCTSWTRRWCARRPTTRGTPPLSASSPWSPCLSSSTLPCPVSGACAGLAGGDEAHTLSGSAGGPAGPLRTFVCPSLLVPDA